MTTRYIATEKPEGEKGRELAFPEWLRNPVGVVLIAAVFFGLFGTLTLAIDIGRPFGRYMSYGYFEHPYADLSHETPRWWQPLADGTLRYGDRFIAINGLPYTPNARTEFARAYQDNQPVQLLIERPGIDHHLTVTLPAALFSFWEFLDVKLPELLVGFVFWMLALIVLRAKSESSTNRVFATVAAAVAIHRLTAVTSVMAHTEVLINLPKIGHMIAAGFIGPLLFHLALLFPTPRAVFPRRVLTILYALGLWSGLTLAASRFRWWGFLPPSSATLIDNVAYQMMLYLLLGGIIALFARLVWTWKFWRNISRRERRVVKIVLVGLLISLPPVIVVLGPIVPIMGVMRSTFWQELDLRYFLLAIPVAFALAIIRYHTFQSPSPLFLFVIVLSISALLAAVGVALWQFSLPEISIVERPPFVLLFVFIFLASTFWSRQADWRGWFGRFLNRTDRNYDAVRAFGSRVMGRNDLRVLPGVMAQSLIDELDLERAAIWLMDSSTNTFNLVAVAGGQEPEAELRIQALGPLTPRPMHAAWPSTPEWLREPAERGKFEALVPLESEGRSIGLLGLGRRWDEEIFDDRDLAVAELVGQQATLFLLAAIQVEELRHVPMRVAEAQERERYRLASELHDTIQQFLGRLPFFLAVSQELMETDRPRAFNLLDRCMDDVEDAAHVLREIRANLAPNQLELSLSKPLDGLAKHVMRQADLSVYLDIPDHLDQSTTVGTRHALYRVIQQALDNTIAHADATEVKVTLRRENGRVLFFVADNGQGFNEAALNEATTRGSFGLQSMRARVETVGGEFSFESAAGQGTVVSGWVPAPD